MFPILIVDDSREDLNLAQRVFHDCGILNRLNLFVSGQECIQFLTKLYGDKPASNSQGCLIFIDLGMPVMSGTQTMAAINELPFGARQWIVMLSGLNDIKFVREGYQLGAKTFLGKPLQMKELNEFIENNERSIIRRMTASGYELSWA